MLRVFIGLGIPYVGVIGLLPLVASHGGFVMGIPWLYAWMFSWFVLTSACLGVCWVCFDRPRESEADAEPGRS